MKYKKDKVHTMKGPDGFWYDPTQLENYFVPKTKTTGMAYLLKELYSKDPYLKDLIEKENPFLKMIKDKT